MIRKNAVGVSVILLCLSLLCVNMIAFAAETEQVVTLQSEVHLYQEGWLGEVSLMASPENTNNLENAKKQIAKGMNEFANEIDISSYRIPSNMASELLNAVINENPEIFFIDISKCKVLGHVIGQYIMKIKLEDAYRYPKKAIENKKAEIEKEVQRILDTVDVENMDDAEKALAVHDWFVLHYAYDYENYLAGTVPKKSHRIDGLFLDKTAVCQGYALGYMYVLERLGIETIYVPSDPMNHAWNMVKIDEAWYHVDVTWDDPTKDDLRTVSHNYFLLSDAEIKKGPDPHYGWISPQTAPNSYADVFWKDACGGMFYKDGAWYFVKGNSIVSRIGKTDTTLLTYSPGWPAEGGYWPTEYCMRIGLVGDQIYYNTPTEIRSFTITNSESTFLVAKPELGSKYIYGIMIDNNKLYYGLAVDPNEVVEAEEEGIVLSYRFSAVREGQNIEITTFGFSSGNLYVAAYKGNKLLSLDVLSIDEVKTKYTSSLAGIRGAEKVRVFAFSGVSPQGDAVTIPLAS